MKVFPLNHLLCTVHNGMGLMHRESFPVNGVFCAQPRKFSPSKVLPYTAVNLYFCPWSPGPWSLGPLFIQTPFLQSSSQTTGLDRFVECQQYNTLLVIQSFIMPCLTCLKMVYALRHHEYISGNIVRALYCC